MKLYSWRGGERNFGDELNALVWPQLLPGLFDQNAAELFLGIGSVLDARHPATATKVVAGAGYGGYEALPRLDATWAVHWVRGPRTAQLLGLPLAYGLGDPAILLGEGSPSPPLGTEKVASSLLGGPDEVGFMPHFESLALGAWEEAAAAAGLTLIDPRGDPRVIISTIGRCRVLLSEAMHGAIVADVMRVPWVALRPLVAVHRGKWQDWADVLDLKIRFQPLLASSLAERLHASSLSASRRGRRLLQRLNPTLQATARHRFIERAVRSLTEAARSEPQLSTTATLDRCRARMLERLSALRRDPLRPVELS